MPVSSRRGIFLFQSLAVIGALGAGSVLASETVDPSLLSAMEWRLVGPYRGGRVTTVAGVPGNPQLYYMGATGGGVLNYHIRDEHEGPLSIEIRDSDGNLVRRFSSEEEEFERCITGNMDQRLPYEIEYPPKERGANKWVWDMRRDGLRCIDDIRVFEGFAGAYVMPGDYQARISVGEVEDTVSLGLVADRRVDASANEFAEVEQRIAESTTLMNDSVSSRDEN
ncbi:MAG: hypothetical protein E2P02_30080 [Acidobacteria bacterium]|nr:MAG: hypothetical protein E2P02_30080 [Acidobacteriota bacterium]